MARSNNLVVVALPAENDYVRQVSSEPEPHLTLLYLGNPGYNAAQISQITSYVEYAAGFLPQFILDTKSRGTLGDQNADVVFFDPTWSKEITRFREQLLQDPLISAAFNATEQFEGWTPHLTLGYPESPAKKGPDDPHTIGYVRFDRIALWTDDSSGPTFILKPSEDLAVAMSDLDRGRAAIDDFLEHHGVKGMKWGVRKDRGHEGQQASTRKIQKLDKKFEKNSQTLSTILKIHNRAADLTNKNDVDRINNKSQYKNADFTKDTPLRRKYYAEHQKAFLNNLEKAASEFGSNASGTKKYTILENGDGSWDVTLKDVTHASDGSFNVHVTYDKSGHIVKLGVPEPSVAHGEELISDFLEHYGVKGMKWGVRRSQAQLDRTSGRTPSADAQAAAAAQAKVNAGGVSTLSNHELQGLVNRLNLEKQYSTLRVQNKSEIDKGLKITKKVLEVGKTVEDVRRFLDTPTGKNVKRTLNGLFQVGKVAAAAYTGGASGAAAAGTSIAVRRTANHFTNVGR